MPAISHAQLSPGCAHEWGHMAWEKREKGLGKIREMDAVLLGLQLPAHTIPVMTRGTLTAAEVLGLAKCRAERGKLQCLGRESGKGSFPAYRRAWFPSRVLSPLCSAGCLL